MAKPLNKKEKFEALKKFWYDKLAKQGFKDIEPSEFTLTSWHSQLKQKYSVEEFQAKQTYYNMANNFLSEHEFKSILDKVIWEYWCNGIPVRDISEQFGKVKIERIKKSTIWNIVRRLEKEMFNFYEADQTKYA